MVRASCNILLIAAACLIAGAKLRHHGTTSPLMATQEVNRCLSVVRAAAAAKDLRKANRRLGNTGAICQR